jgi:hypothetical protein
LSACRHDAGGERAVVTARSEGIVAIASNLIARHSAKSILLIDRWRGQASQESHRGVLPVAGVGCRLCGLLCFNHGILATTSSGNTSRHRLNAPLVSSEVIDGEVGIIHAELLADLPGTVVPNSVLLSLQSMTPDPLERREFLAQRGRTGPLGYVPILWLQYRRNCEATGGRATFAGFLDFLQSLWGVERHEMPGVALGMGWQLFRRRFAAEPKHGRSTR